MILSCILAMIIGLLVPCMVLQETSHFHLTISLVTQFLYICICAIVFTLNKYDIIIDTPPVVFDDNFDEFMYVLFGLLCLAFISIWIHDKLTCFDGEKAYLTNIEDADIQFKPLGNLMCIN